MTFSHLLWQPLIPWPGVLMLGMVLLAGVAWGVWRAARVSGVRHAARVSGVRHAARGRGWRLLPLGMCLLLLAGPRLVEELRTPLADVAVIVVDDSRSMSLAGRREQAEAASSTLAAQWRQQGLEVRVSHGGATPASVTPASGTPASGNPASGTPVSGTPASGSTGETAPLAVPLTAFGTGSGEGGTHLLGAVFSAVADVPATRLAAAVVISDGEIHDASLADVKAGLPDGIPLHALIVGHRHESDRRVSLTKAPAFGLVGQTVTVEVTVDDPAEPLGHSVPLTVSVDGQDRETLIAPLGASLSIPLKIIHAGPTVLAFSTPVRPGELTPVNNRAAVSINGVRDRLKVLLVSGQPHGGERAWRSLLKSDPNVDLIHFTILREPRKDDGVPTNELALIPFPTQELFQDKLKNFDLVIFDRYSSTTIVPSNFFSNVAEYVRGGGAVLVAAGPELAETDSLADTPLAAILPALPKGTADERAFQPQPSALGLRHPIIAGLDNPARWGRWLRVMPVNQQRGNTLLQTPNRAPLLIVDTVGQGRVGMILSDTLWLWAKGWDGGGPHAEMLRRVSHWLMKEPSLEEDVLRVNQSGGSDNGAGRLQITRRSLTLDPDRPLYAPLTAHLTAPDQTTQSLALAVTHPGVAEASLATDQPGVWRVEVDGRVAVAAVASHDPLEDRDQVATDRLLLPVTQRTGGGVFWLEDGLPQTRLVSSQPAYGGPLLAGEPWMGLVKRGDHVVSGLASHPLIPLWLALWLIVGGMIAAWWREGK